MGINLIRLILLLIIGAAAYRFFKRLLLRAQNRGSSSFGPRHAREILDVSPEASDEEIKEAYKKALSAYHPDKVDHLGTELQKVAKEKTKEIMDAYETLMKP